MAIPPANSREPPVTAGSVPGSQLVPAFAEKKGAVPPSTQAVALGHETASPGRPPATTGTVGPEASGCHVAPPSLDSRSKPLAGAAPLDPTARHRLAVGQATEVSQPLLNPSTAARVHVLPPSADAIAAGALELASPTAAQASAEQETP